MHGSSLLRLLPAAVLCTVVSGIAYAAMPLETLLTTTRSRPFTEKTLVVNSPAELSAAWLELGRNDQPPAVDFRKHSVIVYFGGLRPTPGYNLSAEGIGMRGGVLQLLLEETEPGAGCGTPQIGTLPAIAVLTHPWRGRADAEVTRVVRDCGP